MVFELIAGGFDKNTRKLTCMQSSASHGLYLEISVRDN